MSHRRVLADLTPLRDSHEFRLLYAGHIDLNAMVFGMPRALFPELGQTLFRGARPPSGFCSRPRPSVPSWPA